MREYPLTINQDSTNRIGTIHLMPEGENLLLSGLTLQLAIELKN
jgi:hypothetical protein